MKYFKHLYFQVLLAIGLGVLVGWLDPGLGVKLKPLGDGFIKLVKMLIAPIIFCTIVSGIAGMGDLKKIGRLGGKALLYFEVVTTFALAIGLLVANLLKPGAGINADVTTLDASAVSSYTKAAASQSTVEFLLHIIPDAFLGAFAHGEILQVLLISILFGFGLAHMGPAGEAVTTLINHVAQAFFAMVGIVTKLAPIGAFGAIGFTIGKYGIATLLSLGKLLACVYLTSALFVLVVLGIIAHSRGFSLWRILVYIREELLIVLGTSSSESALPGLMTKLEAAGCSRSSVGIVIPAGYSFNLDGTSIYLTMAAIFIAQATNTDLSLVQEIGLLGILLLTSKGAAGVTGSGFVTLAATLAATRSIPVEGLALILGVDRFMSECRAITNFIGNAVGMFVIADWEQDIDFSKAAPLLTRARRKRLAAAATD
ncbi:MAG: dicarboxylate/amino acid:cation symporter [Opitutaceae bacterium]|nr:dicarboxylate/amino acid:cation symporter [Opitutaceae bacterium]